MPAGTVVPRRRSRLFSLLLVGVVSVVTVLSSWQLLGKSASLSGRGLRLGAWPGGPEGKFLPLRSQVNYFDPSNLRIGHAWDIHRFGRRTAENGPFILAGVEVPDCSNIGVVAHSDGDVIFHSVTDAILGSIGLRDIGQYYPDTDSEWKGQSSDKFLHDTLKRASDMGFRVVSVDVTLVLERPKVGKIMPAVVQGLRQAIGDHRVTQVVVAFLSCSLQRCSLNVLLSH